MESSTLIFCINLSPYHFTNIPHPICHPPKKYSFEYQGQWTCWNCIHSFRQNRMSYSDENSLWKRCFLVTILLYSYQYQAELVLPHVTDRPAHVSKPGGKGCQVVTERGLFNGFDWDIPVYIMIVYNSSVFIFSP